MPSPTYDRWNIISSKPFSNICHWLESLGIIFSRWHCSLASVIGVAFETDLYFLRKERRMALLIIGCPILRSLLIYCQFVIFSPSSPGIYIGSKQIFISKHHNVCLCSCSVVCGSSLADVLAHLVSFWISVAFEPWMKMVTNIKVYNLSNYCVCCKLKGCNLCMACW